MRPFFVFLLLFFAVFICHRLAVIINKQNRFGVDLLGPGLRGWAGISDGMKDGPGPADYDFIYYINSYIRLLVCTFFVFSLRRVTISSLQTLTLGADADRRRDD